MTTQTLIPLVGVISRVLLVASLVIGTASCGRRGSPERPPSSAIVTTDEQGNVVERYEEPVDRPFILDPLLQ